MKNRKKEASKNDDRVLCPRCSTGLSLYFDGMDVLEEEDYDTENMTEGQLIEHRVNGPERFRTQRVGCTKCKLGIEIRQIDGMNRIEMWDLALPEGTLGVCMCSLREISIEPALKELYEMLKKPDAAVPST